MNRRRFLKVAGLSAAGACVLGRGAWFVKGEKYDLHLTEYEVPLPRLPAFASVSCTDARLQR